MSLITAPRLRQFSAGCDAEVIAPALQRAADLCEINSEARVACWLGQLRHESAGFTRLEENLNYSAPRLVAVWPKRFPTIEAARPFAGNPQALAEKVYGGRGGNAAPGDGWRFRGRGFTGLTLHDNYVQASMWTGVDLVAHPDMAAEPETAATIAACFWRRKGLNALADRGDVAAITKAINGGLIGLDDRRAQTERARRIFVKGEDHGI